MRTTVRILNKRKNTEEHEQKETHTSNDGRQAIQIFYDIGLSPVRHLDHKCIDDANSNLHYNEENSKNSRTARSWTIRVPKVLLHFCWAELSNRYWSEYSVFMNKFKSNNFYHFLDWPSKVGLFSTTVIHKDTKNMLSYFPTHAISTPAVINVIRSLLIILPYIFIYSSIILGNIPEEF